jgi:hypothetical protein
LLSNRYVFCSRKLGGDPKGDCADNDVHIIGDNVQTETKVTERHAEVEMPVMEVPTIDIPDEAKVPHRPDV